MPLRRSNHLSRGALPSEYICPHVTEEPHRGGLGLLGLSSHEQKKNISRHTEFHIEYLLLYNITLL